MDLTEWTEQQLRHWMDESSESIYIYFYTPLCGTCKMTERMLQVLLTMNPQLPIVKCNINFCPQIARDWRIESVPCLVEADRTQVKRKRYRMQAVDELLVWFQAD
jgi:thioredoxin-like negative regulator of GroEL